MKRNSGEAETDDPRALVLSGSLSQQRHSLQVLLDDGVHDHLEDHLDVGGVGGCGEVVVDEFSGRGVQ